MPKLSLSFQPGATLPLYHPPIAKGMDQHAAAFLDQPIRHFVTIFAMPIISDDLGAQCTRTVQLNAWCVSWHYDRCLNAQPLCCPSNTLCVVTA